MVSLKIHPHLFLYPFINFTSVTCDGEIGNSFFDIHVVFPSILTPDEKDVSSECIGHDDYVVCPFCLYTVDYTFFD